MVEPRSRNYDIKPVLSTETCKNRIAKPIKKPPTVEKTKGKKSNLIPHTKKYDAAIQRLEWNLWMAERVTVRWKIGQSFHKVTGAVLFPVPDDAIAVKEIEKAATANMATYKKKRVVN